MTVPIEIQESRKEARDAERRRIVGMVLALYARYALAGEFATAEVLDKLATDIEHS